MSKFNANKNCKKKLKEIRVKTSRQFSADFHNSGSGTETFFFTVYNYKTYYREEAKGPNYFFCASYLLHAPCPPSHTVDGQKEE
jgi:hypothetical protein